MTRRKILLSILPVIAIAYYAGWMRASVHGYSSGATAIERRERVEHIMTPEPLRALYMTAYVAAVPDWRGRIKKLIEETELNAIIIDIKDYTGVTIDERAEDYKDYLRELHESGIYVIGRVSVFQDQKFVKERPDLAVRRKDNGDVWRDRMGIAWLDPNSREVWEHVTDMARRYYDSGFDEINFDYIRFPSDGTVDNASYTFAQDGLTKAAVMKNFYAFLDEQLRPLGIPISADIFGMTTVNTDDLGIGQILENALSHFDFVAPMVYPSHYPRGFNGHADPNKVPYEIVKYSMLAATKRAYEASTTPHKLRPWLQDFDYGGNYGEAEVRAQKQAVYDAGLSSWMLWDPGVRYTPAALDK